MRNRTAALSLRKWLFIPVASTVKRPRREIIGKSMQLLNENEARTGKSGIQAEAIQYIQ